MCTTAREVTKHTGTNQRRKGYVDIEENTETATAIGDDNSIHNEPTNHTAGTTKRKTAPITAPKKSKSSSNKRRKMHKKGTNERLQTEKVIQSDWEKQINRRREEDDVRKTRETTLIPRLTEELGRGKRLKTKPAKHKDAMIPTERIRRALWKHKHKQNGQQA
jgi:hypothetical protein